MLLDKRRPDARPSGSSGFLGGSGSTAHTPDRDPIGTPIIARGQWFHQLRIVASSVVAAFNPSLMSGALFVGLHGNTGQPRRA